MKGLTKVEIKNTSIVCILIGLFVRFGYMYQSWLWNLILGIHLEGIVVIVGNYGSGKTEVSINLAVNKRREGIDVRVADLDLVNPYFRTREARNPLKELGIEVVLPAENYLQADLPILNPAIAGMIRQPNQLTIIDVGGDDVGATVLASLADAFKDKSYHMLQIVNPMRPFTIRWQVAPKFGGKSRRHPR